MSRETPRPAGSLTLSFLPLLLTYLAVAMNVTVANVALPTISQVMPATAAQLVWMVNITPLASAALILFAGSWGDRFGRRRILLVGISVFLLAAVLSARSTRIEELIVLRALTGVGSALVMPAAMALTFQVVPEPRRRTAIGLLGATQAVGALLGPLLAGALLVALGWGAAFLSVTPLLLVALVMAAALLPRDARAAADPEPVDVAGASLMALGGVLILYSLVSGTTVARQAGGETGHRIALGPLLAGVICWAVLIWWEGRARHPIFVRGIVTDRRFWLPTVIIAAVQLVLGAVMFGTTQFVQLVLGFSALVAGLFLTPTLLVWTVVAASVELLARRLGDRALLGSALGVAAAGLALVGLASRSGDVAALLVGMLMVGTMGVAPSLLTHMAVSVYPETRRSVGSAINSVAVRFGLSFGVALGGLVITTTFAAAMGPALAALGGQLASELATMARNSLGGALQVAAQLPATPGDALAEAARVAFASGYRMSLLVAAGLLALLAVCGGLWLPNQAAQARPGQARPGQEEAGDA